MADEYICKQDAVDYCKALMNAELVQHTDDWGYGKERYNQTEVILNFIENRQPADVVPIIHTRWRHYEGMYVCENCNAQLDDESPFCPICGAKMYEGDEYG